jgi:hypothetical protein
MLIPAKGLSTITAAISEAACLEYTYLIIDSVFHLLAKGEA